MLQNHQINNGEIEKIDLEYFFITIKIKHESSNQRKYRSIGKQTDILMKYLTKLLSEFQVIYQITIHDPDKFEENMSNNPIHNFVTLNDLKEEDLKAA